MLCTPYRLRRSRGSTVSAALFATAVLATAVLATAAIPEGLNFQGRVSVGGIPFSGTGLFKFALATEADTVVWSSAPDTAPADGEPDTAVSLEVSKGLYAAVLGEGMDPLPAGVFAAHDDLRLRVWFNDGSHGFQRLGPDQVVASVAYAHRSSSAETANVAQSLAANPVFSGNSQVSGHLGVNTAAPEADLHVVGTTFGDAMLVESDSTVGTWFNLKNSAPNGRYWNLISTGNENEEGPGALLFRDYYAGQVRMMIDSDGRVGINTIHPTATLDVNGAVKATTLLAEERTLLSWGKNDYGQTSVPVGLDRVIGIAAGVEHSLALREDGSIVGWGDNTFGQAAAQSNPIGFTAIDVGWRHSMALLRDGHVVVWGSNLSGQMDVPPGLDQVVAIAAGDFHNLALRADGQVVGWGNGGENGYGQANVPGDLGPVIAIAAGYRFSLALKQDGHVVGWGDNRQGQLNVPFNLGEVRAIRGGGHHSLALLRDGHVVAWGSNTDGQCNVPPGLDQVVAISAGYQHSLALKSDGTVVAWGRSAEGQTAIPAYCRGAVAIAAGDNHNLVLVHRTFSDLASRSGNPLFDAGLRSQTTGLQPAIHAVNADPTGWAGYFEGRGYFSGPVGINTTTPGATLDVHGDARFVPSAPASGVNLVGNAIPTGFYLRDGANSERGSLGLANESGDYSADALAGDVVLRTGASTTSLFLQNGGGASAIVVSNNLVGIGSSPTSSRRLYVNGNVGVNGTAYASGGFQQSSDARLKTNVLALDQALGLVKSLRGVSFAWLPDAADNVRPAGRQVGFLAQEVAAVLPELVHTNGDGYLSVNYNGVTPVLVEAVKELEQRFESGLAERDGELATVRARLAAKEAELESLRTRVTTRDAEFETLSSRLSKLEAALQGLAVGAPMDSPRDPAGSESGQPR